MSGTKVVNAKSGVLLDLFQCLYMSVCQINNVDIIAHTGSIRSIIIVSEYTEFF